MALLELQLLGVEATTAKYRGLGRDLPRATAFALNRTIFAVRSYARRGITQQTGLPAKYAVRGFTVAKADPTLLAAGFQIHERRIPLFAYVGTKGFRSGKGIAGLAYRAGTVPPGAFFAAMPSGHRGIFWRAGRFGRRGKPYLEKITEVMGPSLPKVVVERNIQAAFVTVAREVFEKRLAYETQRILQRRGDA